MKKNKDKKVSAEEIFYQFVTFFQKQRGHLINLISVALESTRIISVMLFQTTDKKS